jgi:hypothetical protein
MQATSQGNPGMSIGKIALASAIGTTIEWYDFFSLRRGDADRAQQAVLSQL